MNENISGWILEFFLHQQIDERVLNKVFNLLPLPQTDLGLQQCMILRRIETEIGENSISEKVLGLIEELEEIYKRDGVVVPEEMKAAYCTVTVYCILKFVEDDVMYFDAVKRIWKTRGFKMMKEGSSGLVSDELKTWGDEIVEGVWDSNARGKLLEKFKENDAEEVIRVYVAKAWENLGPSFLEMVNDSMADDKVREVLGSSKGFFKQCEPDSSSINVVQDKGHEMSPPEQTSLGFSEEVWVTDNEALEVDESDIYTGSMKLKDITNDPIPRLLNVADTVASKLERDQENSNAPHPSGEYDKSPRSKAAGTLHGVRNTDNEVLEEDDTLVSEIAKNKENVETPNLPADNNNNNKLKRKLPQSLMEPSSTALTDDCDDSVAEVPEEGPSGENDKLVLPSREKKNGSLSNIHKFENNLKRKRKRKWSAAEEVALITYVERYGEGNWTFIVNMYKDVFAGRTGVNLKDKWRDLNRYLR